MKIVFLGDIALNGLYIEYRKQGVNPFAELSKELNAADFVIGNLESIAKGDQGENLLKKPRLTTTVEALGFLKDIHLDVACLAQNHIYDHLEDGFAKTTSFLKDNKIKYLGADYSTEEAAQPLILKKSNTQIGILNYVTHDTNPKLPTHAAIIPNFFEEQRAIQEIISLKKKVDHVVLSLHWGGRVEGGLYPDYNQPRLARKLIDAGVDLIIGHHSHTFQPYEQYKGKYIFYSLGNFCFSNFWFQGSYYPLSKRRRLTGIVEVEFFKTSYSPRTLFYRNQDTCFKKIKHYPIAYHNRIFKVLKSNKFFLAFYYFNLRYLLPLYLFLNRKDLPLTIKTQRLIKSAFNRLQKQKL